jgi:hypothetical protein
VPWTVLYSARFSLIHPATVIYNSADFKFVDKIVVLKFFATFNNAGLCKKLSVTMMTGGVSFKTLVMAFLILLEVAN